MKKYHINALLVCGILLAVTGCGRSMNSVIQNEPNFLGTVTEVRENRMIVEVAEGEEERKCSDLMSVSLDMELEDGKSEYHVGDEVCVYYNGDIAETWPAEINTVYAVTIVTPTDRKIESETPNAMVPSIMYDDNIYQSTGRQMPAEIDESAIVGEIESTVNISELPTRNGQANIPYEGAPYAKVEGGLAVLMDHEWVLFEKRE